MDRHDVERLRRSIVMLQPGAPALNREQADRLLSRLYALERLVDDLREQLAHVEEQDEP